MARYILFITVLLFMNSYILSQSIGTYVFTNSVTTVTFPSGITYYPINGGGGTTDNGYSFAINIPFTFNYGGIDFTQYVMCSNGFLAFGNTMTFSEYSAFYNPWTGTRNNVICYTSRDLAPDASTFFGYVTEGTAPNRVHKIICLGLRESGWIARGNCQIYLYEGTNKIEIIYSAYQTGWSAGCRVGLRGSSIASTELKTLSGSGSTAWTNPTAGSTNTAFMSQTPVNADQGRTYTFFYDSTPMHHISSTTTQSVTSSIYAGATNQQLIGIEVVMGGYSNVLNLTGLTLNTGGSTNAAGDILNAKVYYTGLTGTFSTSSLFGTVYNSPNGSYIINGSQALVNGTNYFWVAYDINPSAVTGNVVDAECNQLSLSGAGGTHVPVVQAPPGSRQIIPAITSVNVGTGELYTSLTNAGGLFEAINAGTFPIAGNTTVNITSNLSETGTFSLNDWQNSYSVSIVPSAAVERLISGSNTSTALITLSGSDKVNIDGRFGGSGKYLRFRNTSGSKPTIQFMNDSKNNIIRDCYIESNNTQTSSGLGTILFSTTTGTSGNDSNSIVNCDIRNRSDAAGNPVYGIVCSGTSGITNDNNTVSGCNIYNFNSASSTYGIYLLTGTGSNWRIENNSFYNTGAIAATFWYAVFISSTTHGNQQISGNYIGGNAPNCGGTALSGTLRTLHGIYLRALSTSSNTVSGNVIRNINITKTSNAALEDGLLGIYTTHSSYTITNNILGDTISNDNVTISGSSGISIVGYFIMSDSAHTLNVSNNIAGSLSLNVGGQALFRVIACTEGQFSNTTKLITNNKIGSFAVPNSIRISSPSASHLTGMELFMTSFFGTNLLNVTGNTVVNLTNMLPNNSFDQLTGISGALYYFNNNAVCNFVNNSVFNLTSPYIHGISFHVQDWGQFTGGTGIGYYNLKNNMVKGLFGAGGSSNTVFGIYAFTKADYNDVSGNKISNLSNSQDGGYISGLAARSNYWWPHPPARYPYEKNLVYNNQISLTNGEGHDGPGISGGKDSYTNSQYILGMEIDHGDSARVYNNTVYIGGVEGGTRYSDCINMTLYIGWNVKPDVRNNLLVNNRTGGGDHSAIKVEVPDSSMGAGTFNYNTYIVSDTNKVCQWYLNNFCSFQEWKDSTESDGQSWCAGTSEVNPLNLFLDAANGNLNLNYNNPQAWIVSGKGIPLSYVTTDYEGNPRSTSVLYGYPTDIGSDEFTQTPPNNPSAIQTGTPGPGNTTTYKLYGRTLMEIEWGSGGTSYPSGLEVKYFSCVEPPQITGGYGYSYWQVTPNGILSGTDYDITLYFGDNETHSITTPALNTRLAKKDSDWEAYTTLGSGELETDLDWANLKAKVRGLVNFSEFALIDFSNPLPVNVCSFDAATSGRNVTLNWQTCSELNNAGFEIQRRAEEHIDGQFTQWQSIGFVEGNGSTIEPKSYSYGDVKLNAGKYQYRLKQVDYSGNFEYYQLSNPEIIEIGKPISFGLSQNYPNPSNPVSKIDYQIPFDGKVSLVVYDVLGREVFMLVNNEIKQAGYYSAVFNGSNLASGIYFYRIIAEGGGEKFTKTHKMILIK